jgi:hypothetical protein
VLVGQERRGADKESACMSSEPFGHFDLKTKRRISCFRGLTDALSEPCQRSLKLVTTGHHRANSCPVFLPRSVIYRREVHEIDLSAAQAPKPHAPSSTHRLYDERKDTHLKYELFRYSTKHRTFTGPLCRYHYTVSITQAIRYLQRLHIAACCIA